MKNVAVGDRDVVLYFSPLVPGDGKTAYPERAGRAVQGRRQPLAH